MATLVPETPAALARLAEAAAALEGDAAGALDDLAVVRALQLHRDVGAALSRRASAIGAAAAAAAPPPVAAASAAATRPVPGGKAGLGEQTVVDAVRALRRGELILVTDDEDRENEGDLIMASELATAERMAFMVRHTSGVVCVSMPGARIDALELPPMVGRNEDPKGTAFTVSVDAKAGTTTGISAADRAETLRQLADPARSAADFTRPGHIFPLRAREGGVIVREGHTEATLDLLLLAGMAPCGALSEVVSADGLEMARMPELRRFAAEHGLALTTIADLVAYRAAHGMADAIRPID
ncbi:hypothetical protein KFE25_011616 [Diacronema lutheri]|uniref:3,4-dihydroxy-2-butanone 4-phosphate synthase n=2 Tax=Diacronema lutheri TaxID=2081491 RepID=A0A8J5XB35_DIALT|nr:hypothetical protein KFE25_011616 [Diacronema lutheri]